MHIYIYKGTHTTAPWVAVRLFFVYILLLFPTRRNIFCSKDLFYIMQIYDVLFSTRKINYIVYTWLHAFSLTLSLSLSLYLPLFLSPPLSGCVQRPIKYYIYYNRCTRRNCRWRLRINRYPSRSIFLTRRKLRAAVINAAVAATASKVIIIDRTPRIPKRLLASGWATAVD